MNRGPQGKPRKSDTPQFIKNLTPNNFTFKTPVIMSVNNIILNLTKNLSTASQTLLTSPFSVQEPPNTILMEAQATNHSFGRNHLLGNCYFSVCDDYNLIHTHCKSVRLFKLTLVRSFDSVLLKCYCMLNGRHGNYNRSTSSMHKGLQS